MGYKHVHNIRDDGTVICLRCNREYDSPEDAFYFRKSGPRAGKRLWTYCKTCAKSPEFYRQKVSTAAGREMDRAVRRRWRAKNAVTIHFSDSRRRQLRKNAGGMFTQDQWNKLCDFCKGKCLWCEQHKTLTIDHVVALTKGGSNDISNIQPLCRACNTRKYKRTLDFRTNEMILI